MLLEIAEVHGGYGGPDVLHGVNLDVDQHEIVTIAGTNGAGKSTLAKAVLGFLPQMRGRIALRGRDLASLAVEDRVDAGLAYVPQVANVFPSLTVSRTSRSSPAFATPLSPSRASSIDSRR
jgi:ABC-type branched-chain amino acid transport systems, ATPase component